MLIGLLFCRGRQIREQMPHERMPVIPSHRTLPVERSLLPAKASSPFSNVVTGLSCARNAAKNKTRIDPPTANTIAVPSASKAAIAKQRIATIRK
jgi:hypothetical protein